MENRHEPKVDKSMWTGVSMYEDMKPSTEKKMCLKDAVHAFYKKKMQFY